MLFRNINTHVFSIILKFFIIEMIPGPITFSRKSFWVLVFCNGLKAGCLDAISMVFFRFTLGILLTRVIPPLLCLWHFTIGVSCHRFMDHLRHKVFGVSGTLVFKLIPYDSLHYTILSKRGFTILPWYLS